MPWSTAPRTPARPENLQAACGPGHRVKLNMSTWEGSFVNCLNCGEVIALWQDHAHYRDRSGVVKRRAGYIVLPEGRAPCPKPSSQP